MNNKFNIDNSQDVKINSILSTLKIIEDRLRNNEEELKSIKSKMIIIDDYYDSVKNVDEKIKSTFVYKDTFDKIINDIRDDTDNIRENMSAIEINIETFKDEIETENISLRESKKILDLEITKLKNDIDNLKSIKSNSVEKLVPNIKISKFKK